MPAVVRLSQLSEEDMRDILAAEEDAQRPHDYRRRARSYRRPRASSPSVEDLIKLHEQEPSDE